MTGATRRLVTRGLTLALVAWFAAACGFFGNDDDNANGGLGGTSWTVMSIAATDTIAGSRPTMDFAVEGTVSGTDGCNRYNGSFHTDGDRIDVGALSSTMMACEAPAVNAQATAFQQALQGATTWRQTETGTLELRGGGDLVAQPAGDGPGIEPNGEATDPARLVGDWTLVDLDGTGDFAHLTLTMAIAEDGTLSGFSGCNTYTGPYSVDGAAITIGPLATTQMACQPPGSTIEDTFLPALDAAGEWQIDERGRLTLTGPSVLTFASGPSA